MKTGMIDSSRIEAMIAQLKAAATRPQGIDATIKAEAPAPRVNFADALKTSLDQVSGAQNKADQLGQSFVMGDDRVSLSDVMIANQKASIGLQATVQARNKLVSAYHEIMSMQV